MSPLRYRLTGWYPCVIRYNAIVKIVMLWYSLNTLPSVEHYNVLKQMAGTETKLHLSVTCLSITMIHQHWKNETFRIITGILT